MVRRRRGCPMWNALNTAMKVGACGFDVGCDVHENSESTIIVVGR